ncbi:S26 family signal peptidase [Streptomyces avermitilis]|uniref:S26 family signal peptidase n=1 Tax=Streptomyces avermitilis TaxID=33903 RepID=UPI0033CBA7F3
MSQDSHTATTAVAVISPSPKATRLTAAVAALLGAGALSFLLSAASGPALLCGLASLTLVAGTVVARSLGRVLVSVTVRGTSMAPAYRDGDRVLVRRDRPPARGQVVVVEGLPPGGQPRHPAPAGESGPGRTWLIKRVAAVPGDPVPRDQVPALAHVREDRVPLGKLVLLGDNLDVSHDSRRMGYFPMDSVLGTVLKPVQPRTSAR